MYDMFKICCFLGQPIKKNKRISNLLKIEIEKLIQKDFSIFFFTENGSFNKFCLDIVNQLKLRYPHIKTICCLHKNFANSPIINNPDYFFDDYFYYNPKLNHLTSIENRDREIINQSSLTIFFINNPKKNSNIINAFEYAKNQNKPFLNFNDII